MGYNGLKTKTTEAVVKAAKRSGLYFDDSFTWQDYADYVAKNLRVVCSCIILRKEHSLNRDNS